MRFWKTMEVKDLLSTPLYNTYASSEEADPQRGALVEELQKVLSDNSREVKSKVTQAKKNLVDEPNRKRACMNYELAILQIVRWDPEADETMGTVDILDALKAYWKWDYEEASNYMVIDEKNEYLPKVTKGFLDYANHFTALYVKTATAYLRDLKKIPDYKVILKQCFCKYMRRHSVNVLKKMEFSEAECKEAFEEIQEMLKDKEIDLEATENIQESFIKLCREKYPLAKKNSDFLFQNKKFKKEFLDEVLKSLDKELETTFNNTVHDCMEDIRKSWELTEEDDLRRADALNIPISIIAAINDMRNGWIWIEWIIALYFQTIAEVFEREHNKRVKKTEDKPTKSKKENPVIQEEWIVSSEVKSWRNTLSEEENNLIKKAVSYLDTKWQEENIIKYLTKLKIKDLPIKFYDFKTLFDIKEIPPQTETILLDTLGLEFEIESEVLKVKEEEKINEEEVKAQTIQQEEIVIDNPEQYLIDKITELWYIIDNEGSFRKQLQEFLENENYSTVLKTHLKNPSFLKIFLHKWWHKAARVIRIGMTGRRLLFEKKRDGKIHLICLANHNNYEDRLAMIKNRKNS